MNENCGAGRSWYVVFFSSADRNTIDWAAASGGSCPTLPKWNNDYQHECCCFRQSLLERRTNSSSRPRELSLCRLRNFGKTKKENKSNQTISNRSVSPVQQWFISALNHWPNSAKRSRPVGLWYNDDKVNWSAAFTPSIEIPSSPRVI